MPSAEILTIGTELLLGEIVDTNSQFLAHCLRDAGIDLFRITTVGDNVNRIAQAIRQSLKRCDILITTGGLGPTVDDPTRDAIALAIGVKNEFQPELWEQIRQRFQKLGRLPTENNKRQAYIPEGATAIKNPVGTAPIFRLHYRSRLIVALPGVPSEMKYLMQQEIIPFLQHHFNLCEMIKTKVLHTVGVGESQIDDLIGDLEVLSNPTVGLAAHSGQVDVRIAVKAESEEAARIMIEPVENTLRSRLGDWIYGVDQETLEEIALRSISQQGWKLTAVEAGLNGGLIRRLAALKDPFISGQVLTTVPSLDGLLDIADSYRKTQNADVGLGVAIQSLGDTQEVSLVLISPLGTKKSSRRYGGPAEYASFWAFNQSLDMIRRITHDT